MLLQRVGFDVIQRRERTLTERTLRHCAHLTVKRMLGMGDTARRHGGKTDKKVARRQMDDLAQDAARRVYAEPA